MDRIDDRGDLISQFDTAQQFIRNHLNLRSIIKGAYRWEEYDIPEEAFREAISNALIHRDYSVRGTRLMFRIFNATI